MKYYIAGGAIRDLLLGRSLRDIDYVFDAPESDFIQRNPSARKLQSGGKTLYLLDGQEYSPLPPGPTREARLAQDALLRDFTINALLLSPDGVLHMHPQSLDDLRHGLLRPVAASSLADAPVRAFRAARFFAMLPDFSLHAETLRQMDGLGEKELGDIAPEQCGAETMKACRCPRPGNFLRALSSGNCLKPWFTELANAASIPAGPLKYHPSSVLEHTAHLMDTVAQTLSAVGASQNANTRPLAVWMALCHDLGKTGTPPETLPKHIGHEERGAEYAARLGTRLRLSNLFIKAGVLAARLHMKAGRYAELRPGSKVDLLAAVHNAGLTEPFWVLAAADSGAPGLPEIAKADLARILAVRLPDDLCNCGELSGNRLRELRCAALASGGNRWS